MSSGSYFTIYRKTSRSVQADVLEAVREEYRKSNASSLSTSSSEDKDDFPVLMNTNFKSELQEIDERCNEYIDKDGVVHEKLLDFHFGSSFTCLKDKFRTNPYKFSESSLIISRDEAEKMLQAAEYVLSENYSKKFEDILSNEYVELFGRGLSAFDDRFREKTQRIYIDKEGRGWTVSFGDSQWAAEIAEEDDDARFNLKRVCSCIRAYLDAETYEYNGMSLVLEYSAY